MTFRSVMENLRANGYGSVAEALAKELKLRNIGEDTKCQIEQSEAAKPVLGKLTIKCTDGDRLLTFEVYE